MDDRHGYGPWRPATTSQICAGCDETVIEIGDRVQTAPDGDQLGECCGVWNAVTYCGADPDPDADLASHVRYVGVCANLDQLQTLAGPDPTDPGRHARIRQAIADLPRTERVHALLGAVYAITDHGWVADEPVANRTLARLTGMARLVLDCTDPQLRTGLLRVLSWQPFHLPAEDLADALTTAVLILAEHGAHGTDYLNCRTAHA